MNMENPYLMENIKLRQRVDELEAELEHLKESVDAGIEWLCIRWNLTRGQAKIIKALSTGHIMSRERLLTLFHRNENTEIRNVDSQIKRIRKKMPDINIRTVYGLGYIIEGADLRKAREAMTPPQDTIAYLEARP